MTITVTNHSTEAYGWQRWHISRPERLNALGTSLAGELTDVLEMTRQRRSAEVRAIVITAESISRGDRNIWIAGGDLKELALLTTKAGGRAYAKAMRLFCEGLESLPMPVVTVIDGAAIGGGAELALAGDIRVATVRSSLEFKQLKLGLATGYGAASRLVDLVGKARAQSILYFSESIDAVSAHSCGLVHRLIPSTSDEDLGKTLLPILQLEPLAVAAQKKMLRLATTLPAGDHSWADDVFESIWLNETHAARLAEFAKRDTN
jgi:enoyl-CoA hydratase